MTPKAWDLLQNPVGLDLYFTTNSAIQVFGSSTGLLTIAIILHLAFPSAPGKRLPTALNHAAQPYYLHGQCLLLPISPPTPLPLTGSPTSAAATSLFHTGY